MPWDFLSERFESQKARNRRFGLPPFFANLLPEDKLREAMEKHHAGAFRPANDFDLLAALGADLPGAVRVLPSDGTKVTSQDSAKGSGTFFALPRVHPRQFAASAFNQPPQAAIGDECRSADLDGLDLAGLD